MYNDHELIKGAIANELLRRIDLLQETIDRLSLKTEIVIAHDWLLDGDLSVRTANILRSNFKSRAELAIYINYGKSVGRLMGIDFIGARIAYEVGVWFQSTEGLIDIKVTREDPEAVREQFERDYS